MLLTRAEMSHDFQDARLDPVADKKFLGWAFNQCLYGEVTGIQVGHWLYDAPDLAAARFFARQAVEEMQHVDNFLAILRMLDEPAKKPHAALRFLATGMMGQSFEEHVMIEMAMGEGQVLMALYAIIDLLDHADAVAILKRAVKQEERHVEFGEQRTMEAVAKNPRLKSRLLGLALVSMFAVEQLANGIARVMPSDHPVLKQLPGFLKSTIRANELRLQRLGLINRPLAEISLAEKAFAIVSAYGWKAAKALLPAREPRRVTDTYLNDPIVQGFANGKAAEGLAKAAKSAAKLSVV
ncbi:MAG: ferritin-like domain-containing protein [Deltaproteobacteria bacterium]|nr:ferritin-like domain-containing protein [Deltaproteobacteria bacterium]